MMRQWIQRVFMQIAVVLDHHPELLQILNDVNTFMELVKALREGNTRRAAWKAFLLGMAFATYLQLLMDLLDDDDDDNDNDDNDHTTEIAPDEPPSGGLAEPAPVRYLRELLEQDHRVH